MSVDPEAGLRRQESGFRHFAQRADGFAVVVHRTLRDWNRALVNHAQDFAFIDIPIYLQILDRAAVWLPHSTAVVAHHAKNAARLVLALPEVAGRRAIAEHSV